MCSHLQSLHFISSDSKRYFSGIQTERINCSKEMAFHLSEHLVFTSNVRWAFNTAVTLWLINLLTSCPTSSKMGIPKAFYMSIFRSFFAQLQQVFKTLPFFQYDSMEITFCLFWITLSSVKRPAQVFGTFWWWKVLLLNIMIMIQSSKTTKKCCVISCGNGPSP